MFLWSLRWKTRTFIFPDSRHKITRRTSVTAPKAFLFRWETLLGLFFLTSIFGRYRIQVVSFLPEDSYCHTSVLLYFLFSGRPHVLFFCRCRSVLCHHTYQPVRYVSLFQIGEFLREPESDPRILRRLPRDAFSWRPPPELSPLSEAMPAKPPSS